MHAMSRMAAATPPRPQSQAAGIAKAHKRPTTADAGFPPRIARGRASGLAGIAKASTAEAPSGGTSSGERAGPQCRIERAPKPVTTIAARPSPVTGLHLQLRNFRRRRGKPGQYTRVLSEASVRREAYACLALGSRATSVALMASSGPTAIGAKSRHAPPAARPCECAA
jgi:hypothetical protein